MPLIYLYGYMFVLFLVGLWPLNFWQANGVGVTKEAGIVFDSPATAYTKAPAGKLAGLREFTLFLDVTPSEARTNGYARIMGYELAGDHINFIVSQWNEGFVFLLRPDKSDRVIHLEKEEVLKKDRRAHIAVVYGAGRLSLYANGAKIKDLDTGPLGFTGWSPKYPLVFGSDGEGTSCWNGYMRRAAIFDRALSGDEIARLPEDMSVFAPLVFYSSDRTGPRLILDGGSGEPANLVVPQKFRPYQRRILEPLSTDLAMYGHHVMDILINVVGFLPLGFLFGAYLAARRASPKKIILASLILGTATSLAIELLQVLLPTRTSSLTDVLTNAMGSVLGALVLLTVYTRGSRNQDAVAGLGGRSMTELAGSNLAVSDKAAHGLMDTMNRHIAFLFLTLVSVAMFYEPLRALLRTYTETDSYLHIILIPLISGYLLYQKRETLLTHPSFSWKAGIPLMIIGLAIFFKARGYEEALGRNDYASVMTISAAVFWIGSLLLVYGFRELRSMLFPMVFLIFMIPVPSPLMNTFVEFLRYASTGLVDVFFRILGTPFVRDGYIFHLPNVSVEVAEQCSGIHSSFALLIVSILASHIFIKTRWKKAVAIVAIVPIVVVKNAIRIVTLSLLGAYVDEQILTHSFLHQSGGFLFYVPALILIIAMIWTLGRTERTR